MRPREVTAITKWQRARLGIMQRGLARVADSAHEMYARLDASQVGIERRTALRAVLEMIQKCHRLLAAYETGTLTEVLEIEVG